MTQHSVGGKHLHHQPIRMHAQGVMRSLHLPPPRLMPTSPRGAAMGQHGGALSQQSPVSSAERCEQAGALSLSSNDTSFAVPQLPDGRANSFLLAPARQSSRHCVHG